MNSCTFGVEEEFIVVDPANLMPVKYDFNLCMQHAGFKRKFISREMHHGVLETKTPICHNLAHLAEQMSSMRELAKGCVELQGLRLMSSGTHPIASWQDVPMVHEDVYADVVNEYQDVARSNYIFGMHIHIGLWHTNLAIPVANAMREYLPMLLALSANSPFWKGRNTGVKSFRNRIFKKMPRSGLPPIFDDMQHYDDYLAWLITTGCIHKPTSIWWDIRVHPIYRTVEVRVMDQQSSRQDAIALALFVGGLANQVAQNIWQGEKNTPADALKVEENMWRATRYGIDAQLINFRQHTFSSARQLITEKLNVLQPIFEQQKCDHYMDYIRYLIKNPGAEKQLANQNLFTSPDNLLRYLTLSEKPQRVIRVA